MEQKRFFYKFKQFIFLIILFSSFINCHPYCDKFCYCDSSNSHWICGSSNNQTQSIDINKLPSLLKKLEVKNSYLKNTNKLIKFVDLIELKLKNVGLSDLPKNFNQNNLITLDLSQNNFKKLSKNMLKMSSLEQLDLSKNQLITIDYLFDDLVLLKQLNLSHNMLTRLNENSFSKLINLQYLNLKFNRLHHIELGTFYKLPNLVKLVLDNNMRLDHTKLDLVAIKMRSLHLSQTNLTVIPQFIGKYVRELYLDHNFISKLSIEDFEHLSDIRILHLENNFLKEIEFDTFGRMIYLVELDLSSNHLLQVPGQLPKTLRVLDLSDNLITELDCKNLKHLVNIVTLNLSANNIRALNKNCLSSFNKLEILDLSENQFLSVDKLFSKLNNLKTLDLSNNNLLRLNSVKWLNLVKLKNLNLSYLNGSLFNCDENRIFFNNLHQLESLNLTSNSILLNCLFNNKEEKPVFSNLKTLVAKGFNLSNFNSKYLHIHAPQLEKLDLDNKKKNCDPSNIQLIVDLIYVYLKNKRSINLIGIDEWLCKSPMNLKNKKVIELVFSNFTRKNSYSSDILINHNYIKNKLVNNLETPEVFLHQITNFENQFKLSKLFSNKEVQLALVRNDNQPIFNVIQLKFILLISFFLLCFIISVFIIVKTSKSKSTKTIKNKFDFCFKNFLLKNHHFKIANYNKHKDDVYFISQYSNDCSINVKEPLIKK